MKMLALHIRTASPTLWLNISFHTFVGGIVSQWPLHKNLDYCLNPAKLPTQLLLLYCFFVYLACQNKTTLWKSVSRSSLSLKCPIKSFSLKTYLGGSSGRWKKGRERNFIKIFVGADPGGRYGESITTNLQRSMSYKKGKSSFQVSYLFLILVLDLITLQFSSLVFEGMGMVITNFHITTFIWLNIYVQNERCPITYFWLTVLTYFKLLKVFLMKN